MKIAVLGGNSQIAIDFMGESLPLEVDVYAFSRKTSELSERLKLLYPSNTIICLDYPEFSTAYNFDLIINFVGVGDPGKSASLGAAILDVTFYYDSMAIEYIKERPKTQYVFISSGAVYGTAFDNPVNDLSRSNININALSAQDWYSIAKIYAESRHRALSDLNIVDIRVFSYFSHRQDFSGHFFLSEVARAITEGKVLMTGFADIVRDYITPPDFLNLLLSITSAGPVNDSFDCYTKKPIRKFQLLDALKENFGLEYTVEGNAGFVNATGWKENYFSESVKAGKYGYRPSETSLSGVLKEFAVIFEEI